MELPSFLIIIVGKGKKLTLFQDDFDQKMNLRAFAAVFESKRRLSPQKCVVKWSGTGDEAAFFLSSPFWILVSMLELNSHILLVSM